jgi:hypothetical protein
MQYILTQEEYDALRKKQTRELNLGTVKLQELCTKIADTMPVLWGWSKDETAKPWGCIRSTEDEWYCDSCPVQEICPYTGKEWSK